jgi:phospholipase/carboxylesterase
MQELINRSLALPDVKVKQSRMALPDVRALCLPDELAFGPPSAFIDGHEFCHLHPAPAGAIHLTLPPVLLEEVVDLGWAEPHQASRIGAMPHSLLLVYAPRNASELRIILGLVRCCYRFALGATTEEEYRIRIDE